MLSCLRTCSRGIAVARDFIKISKRSFLSENFRCHEAWTKRLESPILQQVKLGDMYVEMDAKLDNTGEASAVDIDIFANALTNADHLDELDNLVHRFRLGPGSEKTLPSTHHAVVRAFLAHGDSSELLRILDDRLNYGIFPDDYLNLFLIDHFLKKGDFVSSAKVATMRTLQEDFSNNLLNYMSLFACHKYLLNPTEWSPPEEPVPDDEEEIKVRVDYIRNPFFDDHFDLKDPYALIGKTFHFTCRTMVDSLGTNYRAVGLCLHKKWDEAEHFIAGLLNSKTQIYSSAIELIDQFIGTLPEEEQKPLDALKSVITSARNSSVKKDLLEETNEKIKALVQTEEPKIINKQCQAYAEWENLRENVLRAELEDLRKKQRLLEVKKKKEELNKEEEKLFFFDNEEKLDMAIERKNMRKGSSTKWPGKIKKKRAVGAEYVPPEISSQRSLSK